MTDEELIRKVAEKAMGWTYRQDKHVPHVFYLIGWIEKDDFNPLTNLNHAFMVVERIRELGFAVSLCNPWFDGTSKQRKEWSVSFFTETNVVHGINQNIGHAICLAALKAVRNG